MRHYPIKVQFNDPDADPIDGPPKVQIIDKSAEAAWVAKGYRVIEDNEPPPLVDKKAERRATETIEAKKVAATTKKGSDQ
jgi:hypothetical protein